MSYRIPVCPECGERGADVVVRGKWRCGHGCPKKHRVWVDAVSVEVYTRADAINRVRDEAAKLQDVGFSRRVGDVLLAAFPDSSTNGDDDA